jgi:aarF domain-containing kinase
MTAITYVPPVPVVMPAPATSHQARRAAETAAVFARHLGPVLVRRAAKREVAPAEIGRRLRLAFEALGSTYVKFGQLIGSSPGAFGQEVSDEFRTCLDTGPAVPFTHVRREVEAAVRGRLDDVFETFESTALASASIAVVHRARLKDGRDVAVKVLRPGIVERVASDLDVMEPLFKRLALAGMPIAGPLFRFLRGFRTQVCEELDLRNEARTMTYFRHLLHDSGLDSLVIPEPYAEWSNANVLVMEFLDGVAIDDVEAIAELGGDPGALMQDMLRAWFLTGLRDAMFHGDIHAGNLMLLRDGRAGIIDWGIVGRLDGPTHRLFRRFVEAVLGDATAWPEIVAFLQEMTPLPTAGDDASDGMGIDEAEKAEIEAILTRPFGEVDLTGAFKGPGGNRPPKDRAEKRRRRAQLRRFRKDIIGTDFVDSGFAQANFLLFKQLLYFERYGKLYLADQALMGDRPWLEKILAESAVAGDDRKILGAN